MKRINAVDVETEWNLKEIKEEEAERYAVVDVETEWNLKTDMCNKLKSVLS